MLVKGGQSANFNYPTYDQATGLFVAGSIYDVTTGAPSLVGSPIAMTDESNGVYVGSFTPVAGKSYLVISAVYLDSGFTEVDTSRAPEADQYDAFTTDTSLLNFNYGAYDQDDSLTLSANVFNLTDSAMSTVAMAYVTLGVYFGRYQGAVGKSYAVIKSPSDTTRPPGADSFQTFLLSFNNDGDPNTRLDVAGIVYDNDEDMYENLYALAGVII